MKVQKTSISLISIVEFENIPIMTLLSSDKMTQIQRAYNFGAVEPHPGSLQNLPTIRFSYGSKLASNQRDVPILKFEIDPRKIVVEVEGTSDEAEEIYETLLSDVIEMVPETKGLDFTPVIFSFESIIVAQMDFHASKLINPLLSDFIDEDVQQSVSRDLGDAIVNVDKLILRCDYPSPDPILTEYQINLVRKEFSIFPREGTPLKDQKYVSRAPIRTEEHIKLLEKMEKILI